MLENGFQSPLAGVPARQPSHGWWIAASVFVAALVVGSVGGWRIAHWRQPGAVGRAYRLQLNLPEGATFIAAASNPGIASAPDSSAVVYTAAMSGKSALWFQPLDGPARMLPGTEGGFSPFFSPDSKSVGFFAQGRLMRIAVAGGAPSAVCEKDLSLFLQGDQRCSNLASQIFAAFSCMLNTSLSLPTDKPMAAISSIVARLRRAVWKCCTANAGPLGLFVAGSSRWAQKHRKPSRSDITYKRAPSGDQTGFRSGVWPSVTGTHSVSDGGCQSRNGAMKILLSVGLVTA